MPHVDLVVSDDIVALLEATRDRIPHAVGVLFRVDEKSPDNRASIKSIIDTYRVPSTVYLCVREAELAPGSTTESNPHYHGFMFIEKGRYAALRQAIKRIWKGNKDYSLKLEIPQKTPGYFNYLGKGNGTGSDDPPDVLYSSVHCSDELLKGLTFCYWRNKANINSATKKRKREVPIQENIIKLCRERHYTEDDKDKIYDVVKEFYLHRMKHWRNTYVRDLIWTTRLNLSPNGEVNRMTKDFCTSIPFQ